MDSNENIYKLNQGDKEYILTTNIVGNAIRITCKNILNDKAKFSRDFTIDELKRIDHVFNFIQTPFQGLEYIDKALKNQKVGVSEEGENLKINFYVTTQGISHQLEIPLGDQNVFSSGFNNSYSKTTETTTYNMNQNFGGQNANQFLSQFGNNDLNPLGNAQNTTNFGTIDTTTTSNVNADDQIKQLLQNLPGSSNTTGANTFTQTTTTTTTEQSYNNLGGLGGFGSTNTDINANLNSPFLSPPIIGPVVDSSSSSNDFLKNLQNNTTQFTTTTTTNGAQDISSQFNFGTTTGTQDTTSQFNFGTTTGAQDTTSQFNFGTTTGAEDVSSQFNLGNTGAQDVTSQLNLGVSEPQGVPSQYNFTSTETKNVTTSQYTFGSNGNQDNQFEANQFGSGPELLTKFNLDLPLESAGGDNQFIQTTTETTTEKVSTFPTTPGLPTDASFEPKFNNFETAQTQTDYLNQTKEATTNTNFPGGFSNNYTETKTQYDITLRNVPNVQPQPVLQPQPQIMQSLQPTVQNVPDERINRLEGDTNSLRSEHQFLQDKINSLTGELNSYRNKLELMEKEKAASELNALKAENQAIKQQLSELYNLRNESSEVRMLRSQLSELDPLRRKVAEMEVLKGQLNELNSLRAKVAELSNVKSQLGELNSLRQQVSQMNLLKSQLDELNSLKSKVAELSGVKSQLGELNSLRQQVGQMNLLKQQLGELNNLKQSAIESDNLRRKINDLENIKIQYEQEIRNLRDAQNRNINMEQNKYSEYQRISEMKMRSGLGMNSKQLLFEDKPQQICVKGDIIHNTDELELITRKINKLNQKLTLNLLYKATADSDKASAFHSKCDDAKSSLVLVETDKGKRFGGFTTCSWSGDCIDKKDEDAFVFSLDKMMTYDNIPGEDAIGCYPKFGPIFLGCQIRIYDNAFSKGGTTFEKGLNFNTEEDYELTGGEREFNVREIEVYEVIPQ